MEKKFSSGATENQRLEIREKLNQFVAELANRTNLPPEAVVLELRYYHQSASNPYRTHATKKDKSTSLKHHQNICQYPGCETRLTLDSAHFHHTSRGFSGQHEPHNLIPMCGACHNKEHDIPAGKSLTKGSKKKVS